MLADLPDLPGLPKDKLELCVDGDRLLIEGVVATAMPPQLQSEDAVLTLRIPRQEHAKPRRIEVRAG
ncbi:MAG: hypothetical protein ABL916_21155 [Burkholderiaceae bacterium]